MAINPYGLNKRIVFGDTKTVTNPNTGGPVPEFKPEFKRWCAASTTMFRHRFEVIDTEFENSVVVIIRHTPKVKKKMLAQYDGEIYKVIDVSSDESVNIQRFDFITLQLNKKVM